MLDTMHRTQTPINLVRGIGRTKQNGKIMKWQVFKNKAGKYQVVEVIENHIIPNYTTVKVFKDEAVAHSFVAKRHSKFKGHKNVAISH